MLYFLVIWGTIACILVGMTISFTSGESSFIGEIIGIMIIGLLLWVWFGTGYRIENETLQVVCGPFRWKINIQEIKRISKNKSVWSAPALAIDRLGIKYGRYGGTLIAPKNEAEFIRRLMEKNSTIQVDESLFDNTKSLKF